MSRFAPIALLLLPACNWAWKDRAHPSLSDRVHAAQAKAQAEEAVRLRELALAQLAQALPNQVGAWVRQEGEATPSDANARWLLYRRGSTQEVPEDRAKAVLEAEGPRRRQAVREAAEALDRIQKAKPAPTQDWRDSYPLHRALRAATSEAEWGVKEQLECLAAPGRVLVWHRLVWAGQDLHLDDGMTPSPLPQGLMLRKVRRLGDSDRVIGELHYGTRSTPTPLRGNIHVAILLVGSPLLLPTKDALVQFRGPTLALHVYAPSKEDVEAFLAEATLEALPGTPRSR